jgi:hypothetical protein
MKLPLALLVVALFAHLCGAAEDVPGARGAAHTLGKSWLEDPCKQLDGKLLGDCTSADLQRAAAILRTEGSTFMP